MVLTLPANIKPVERTLFLLNSKKIFQEQKDRSIKGLAFYLKIGVEIIMPRIVTTEYSLILMNFQLLLAVMFYSVQF